MAGLPQRRHIRLPPPAYAGESAVCSITMAVAGRVPVFAEPAIAAAAAATLVAHAERTDVSLVAWCIMPDHVHVVLSPSATCDVVTFVGQFKNLAQREAWRLGLAGRFWQRSFWDRFIRRDEDLRQVVKYVLQNPVRAGLVAAAEDYAYCWARGDLG